MPDDLPWEVAAKAKAAPEPVDSTDSEDTPWAVAAKVKAEKPKKEDSKKPVRDVGPIMGEIVGAGETAWSMGSGLVSSIAGGLTGLAATPLLGASKGADISRGIQEAGTYQPRSEQGKRDLAGVGKVMQPLEDLGDWAQRGTEETGAAGAGVMGSISKAGIENLPMLLGLGGTSKIAGAAEEAVAAPVKSVGKWAGEQVFGTPGPEHLRLWDKATKDWGLDIEPSQAQRGPNKMLQTGLTERSAKKNQNIINDKATAPVGEKGAMTPAFFNRVSKRIGAEYDDIYSADKTFQVDRQAIEDLRDFVKYENGLGEAWSKRNATRPAESIINTFEDLTKNTPDAKAMGINGKTIQRLRSQLRQAREGSNDSISREAIGQVMSALDDSVARNHPDIAARLKKVNPEYRTLSTLDTLRKRGVINEQGDLSASGLGEYLTRESKSYRSGTDTHPLAELGQVGENFGLRRIDEGHVTAGQGTRAGAIDHGMPTTKASAYRMAKQHVKRMATPFFDKYRKSLGEQPEVPPTELGAGDAAIPLTAAQNAPWRKKDE